MADEGEPPAAGGAPVEPTPAPATEPAPPEEDWATRFKYLLADFENFRKRVAKDRENHRQQTHVELMRRLLPILEASQRARTAVERLSPQDPVRRGVELLVREWENFTEAEGLRPVAAIGARFESDRHEAVAEAPATPERPSGSVVEIVQQGYQVGSALVRPAKVVVARARPTSTATEAATETAPDSGSTE